MKSIAHLTWVVAALAVTWGVSLSAADFPKAPEKPLGPQHDRAWIGKDGMRAAWVGYKTCTPELVAALKNARVNTVILGYGLHDLLDMDSARWEDGKLMIDSRGFVEDRLLGFTDRAARAGIHVFWMANYELNIMQSHLDRLGYQAANVEGPTRFIPPGPKKDVSPFDQTFWRGILAAHGEMVARLSLEHPIEGSLFDAEHYGDGIMYLQSCGFDDETFEKFCRLRGIEDGVSRHPAGSRYEFLNSSGRLMDYYRFLEDKAFEQGRVLATRWRKINPRFMAGFWPLLDNWFSRGMSRGLGGATPSLAFSGVEYYHGADQSKAMAEFFETRIPHTRYMAGFYPPYAYSLDQLEIHVARAIRDTGGYWMLGSHVELLKPEYQAVLRRACEKGAPFHSADSAPVELKYGIAAGEGGGPALKVSAAGGVSVHSKAPRLSLWSADGGAPLCEKLPMRRNESGDFEAVIPLVRRLTANRFLGDGFRAGAQYRFDPIPRALMYEDPNHTKLVDGMAYGFYGTTVAWEKSLAKAQVEFDLSRDFEITRVQLAQPSKLEDRNGGPARATIRYAEALGKFSKPAPFESDFKLSGSDYVKQPSEGINDGRHKRGWLTWSTQPVDRRARFLRVELERVKPGHSLSLGEVVIWGRFRGEIAAAVDIDGKRARIGRGRRFTIE